MLMRAPHGTITEACPQDVVLLTRQGWVPVTEEVEAADGRPSEQSSKADWVAYANALSLDVEGLSKAEIIEKVG